MKVSAKEIKEKARAGNRDCNICSGQRAGSFRSSEGSKNTGRTKRGRRPGKAGGI